MFWVSITGAILLISIKLVLMQPVPISPCPETFIYQFNGIDWYGVIDITDGIVFGGSNLLTVNFAYPIVLETSFLGSLELLKSREETIQDILKNDPIKYLVKFPIQTTLPKIVSIDLNNQIICKADQEIQGFRTQTNIKLQHTLYTQLAAQKLAAAALDPVTNKPPFDQTRAPIELPKKADLDRVECGQIDSRFIAKPLIVGGKTITKGSWPWLAGIFTHYADALHFQCCGNLVSAKAVLTSAHCFDSHLSADDYIIFLGRHDISEWNERGSVARSIDDVFFPASYKLGQANLDSDIAVIILKNTVRFTEFIKPVCLPEETQPIIGEEAAVVGWERDHARNAITVPKRLEVNIVSDITCLSSNPLFRLLTSNRTFCAGNRNGKGPCTGDSGSGLMVRVKERWKIVGLVSAALADPNMCDLNEYIIYTDVRKFLNWISVVVFMNQ